MAKNKQAYQPLQDIVTTTQTTVVCDGGGGAIGHPQIFLHINHKTGDVVCPYCDRRYVLEK
jgi:uncharacterized Zn-finger protein